MKSVCVEVHFGVPVIGSCATSSPERGLSDSTAPGVTASVSSSPVHLIEPVTGSMANVPMLLARPKSVAKVP